MHINILMMNDKLVQKIFLELRLVPVGISRPILNKQRSKLYKSEESKTFA